MKKINILKIIIVCLIVSIGFQEKVVIVSAADSQVSRSAPSSYSDLVEKLNALMGKYVGTYWTTDGKPSDSAGTTSKYYYGIQCKGFAGYIFNELFSSGYIGKYDSNKYYIPQPNGATEVGKKWNLNSNDVEGVKSLLSKGQVGDLIQVRRRNKTYGHTMILVGVDSGGISVFDCNSDGKCGVRNYYITWASFASANIGVSLYHSIYYPMKDDIPLSKPGVNSNQSTYTGGESAIISWNSVPGASVYWLDLWHQGEHLNTINVTDRTSYEIPNLKTGSYCVYITAANNSYSSLSDGCFFQVNAMSKPNVRSDKNTYIGGETATVSWNIVSGATVYWLDLWYQGEHISTTNVTGRTSYQLSDLKVGSYCIYITAANNSYNSLSEGAVFSVTSMSTPIVSSDHSTYSVGDSAFIFWNRISGATVYWLDIWYAGEHIDTINVTESSSYEIKGMKEGRYCIYITAANNTYSNLSEKCVFHVSYSDGNEQLISDGRYRILSAINEAYGLDVYDRSMEAEANVLLYEHSGNTNQLFDVTYLGNGYYKITAAHSGLSLDVYNSEMTPGTNVSQYDYHDAANQQWIIQEAGDGYFNIISKCNNLCLNVDGNEAKNSANINVYSRHTGLSEKWKFVPCLSGDQEISDGVYQIVSGLDNDFFLGFQDRESNAEIGTESQNFNITYLGDGYYQILENGGHALEVDNTDQMKGRSAGANAHKSDWINGEHQKWLLKDTGDGYFYIICKENGLYLDVHEGVAADGANVDLCSGNERKCQKWAFVKKISLNTIQISSRNYIYDGTAKEPEVVVKNGDEILKHGIDYTVTYLNNINAGTATVVVKGKGTYTGTIKKDFVIERAEQMLTMTTPSVVKEDELFWIVADGQGALSYVSSNSDVVEINERGRAIGKKVGIAEIEILASGNENYYSASKKISVKVTHNYNEGVVTINSTCTKNGKRVFTCNACGDVYTEIIQASGHKYEDEIVQADCKEQGYTLHSCSVCGDSYKDTYVNALGHDFGEGVITTPATDESNGIKTYTCSRCGETKTEVIPAKGHSYDSGTITKEATCTEPGIITYHCTDCDMSYTVEIPVAGHQYSEIVTAPTCMQKGYTTHTCSVCGNSYKDAYTDILEHTWDNGTIITAPECENAGIKRYTCTSCGETKTEAISATGHTLVIDEAKAASCTKSGLTEGSHCSVCGAILVEQKEIPAIGHSYSEWEVTIKASCTKAGEKEHTCFACGEKEMETLTALGHSWDDGKITEAATERTDGIKTYTCKICGEVKTESIHAIKKEPTVDEPEKPSGLAVGAIVSDIESRGFYKILSSGTVEYQKPINKYISNIIIPDIVVLNGKAYQVTSVAVNALKNSKSVLSVSIGKNVTAIGANAFAGCSRLKKVIVGKGVTVIGAKAFYKCTSLTKTTLPAKVSRIGKQTFSGCKKLKNIIIKSKKLKNVGSKAFQGIHAKAVIKVPKAKLKVYKKLLKTKGGRRMVSVKN